MILTTLSKPLRLSTNPCSLFTPLLLFAFILHPTLVHSAVSTVQSTVTASTVSSAPTAASTQYTDDNAFQQAMIDAHNFYREEHNASALTWNDTSATYAANWAGGCSFQHSGGPTGENLAAGYPNATASVDGWGTERNTFDFSNPQFSETTGHFTQVVWKATTSVGCGRSDCNGKGGTTGWYVVCEYFPPGNVVGEFAANVQSQVKGPKDGDVEGGLGGGGGGGGSGAAGRLGAEGRGEVWKWGVGVAVGAVVGVWGLW